jgi:NAD(P)-dependent dehydrogenase (short-subunit alcohol dehydrogenase family)
VSDPRIPQRALVTGAGARLGAAMARALGERGFQVAVHYRSSEKGAEETVAAIRAGGGEAEAVQANLAEENELRGLIAKAEAALGGSIGVLVNCASTFQPDKATDFSRRDWDLHMDANAYGPIVLAQEFAKRLPDEAHGVIVNLVDQRVWKLNPTFFTYTLSKALLFTATKTLAQALSPRIRVNAIGPGPTLRSVHQSEDDFAAETHATLTGEGSSPDEICRALLYLLDATSVTGQMIASDGGQHLMWQTPDIDLSDWSD